MWSLRRPMRGRLWITLAVWCGITAIDARGQTPNWLDPYREPAARLIGEATGDTFAWRRLAILTDTIGHRLSGSPQLERAVEWAVAEMKRDGLENVHAEKVLVPHWVRGNESAEIVEPAHHALVMLGLGNSVGTRTEGVQGEILTVRSFNELESASAQVTGRIVFFNVPYMNYEETVAYRTEGPSRAARLGAVAALVRSIGPPGLRTPHTGALQYAADAPRIPAAAVTTEDADRLQRMADRGGRVVVRLRMEAHFEADAESANVVGELRGREKPNEVVVVGGHLDSWDVGAGASDDGGGCVVTWEALRLMKKLNLRPRRTVRVVLWTNEENGTRGGNGYRDQHANEAANHILSVESDTGVFAPARLGFSGSEAARKTMTEIALLLAPLGMQELASGGGGADIGPISALGKVPMMAYSGDSNRYFTIHHTPADTVDRIDPQEVSKAAASLAAMIYVVADMPQALPK